MINQTTFENLSQNLIFYSENVVFEVGEALLELNQKLIEDPNNINRAKLDYQKKIELISKSFGDQYKIWADEEIAQAYILGLKSANFEINSIGILRDSKNIINGTSLINVPPGISIPEIPGQILLKFKGFENHIEFFNVFRAAAYYHLQDKPFQIMRRANDVFREVAAMVGEQSFKESDIFTRRQFSQKLLNEYAKKGLQTITYKDGRRVSIDNYCEMLGRTLSGRCSAQASINRYIERGYDLGIVSAHFRACDLCTPFEGTVLSLDGLDKRYPSIGDAETQGLWHANCKHDISPFFEGITPEIDIRVDRWEQKLIDEYGYNEAQKKAYAAQQKQRYIERQIRKYKRRDSVSLDNVSKDRANVKIKEWQKIQREHLKENTFLQRKYEREQIKKAH